ncbi:MAG TPA: hypothetical protein VFA58_01015 [Chthoniobacterales bacterium]|nr:hypothetical protein [Chthoniobacterales bacterium]
MATRFCLVFPRKSLNLLIFPLFDPAILIAFHFEALYTMTPKGENSSYGIPPIVTSTTPSGDLNFKQRQQFPGGVF